MHWSTQTELGLIKTTVDTTFCRFIVKPYFVQDLAQHLFTISTYQQQIGNHFPKKLLPQHIHVKTLPILSHHYYCCHHQPKSHSLDDSSSDYGSSNYACQMPRTYRNKQQEQVQTPMQATPVKYNKNKDTMISNMSFK